MTLSKALTSFCVVASILGTSALAQGPAKPTAEHKILASAEGTWDVTIKSFTPGSDAQPAVTQRVQRSTGCCPGGLWMLSRFEGEFPGMKFEGRGKFGYDPVKQKYVGTWIDSMSPAVLVGAGRDV